MSRRRRAALVVFLLLLYGYCYNGGGWNQNARYDPIFGFVEPGPDRLSFRIDGALPDPIAGRNTGDWARSPVDGRYYSNKAPGTTLLGILPYAVLYGLQTACGADPRDLALGLANAYLLHLLITVLPLALSAPSFYVTARRHGAGEREALLLTLGLYLCSLLLPFATQLWGHPTATAWVVFALRGASGARLRDQAACGLFAGLAVLTDYAAAIPALALTAYVAWRAGPGGLRALALGALGPALAFGAYHQVCFGSPLALAASHSNPIFVQHERVGALFGALDPAALWGLTLGLQRGLLVSCPVLLLAPWTARQAVHAGRGAQVALCASVAAGLLVVNACFNGWHAGQSFGARYQMVALPCWFLLLVGVWELRRWRALTTALLALSLAHMLVGLVATPMVSGLPAAWQKALAYLVGGAFPSTGVMRVERFFVYADLFAATERAEPAFNLGELLGLPTRWSLLPLLPLAAAFAWTQLLRPRHPDRKPLPSQDLGR